MPISVTPSSHRACARSALVHPLRSHTDGRAHTDGPARGCTVRTRARGTTIPFGRNSDGTAVSWDLASGRNLLVRRDERRSSPSVALDLIAMRVLTGGTHDLVVVDPHRRHPWLAGPGTLPEGSRRATTPEEIAQVVADLDSPVVGRPAVLLVADLAATVALLDEEGRVRLAAVVLASGERNLVCVATTADTNPRWYPDGLIDAFGDLVV